MSQDALVLSQVVAAEQLAVWLSTQVRQARRYMKRYRSLYPGGDLSRTEAEHLVRARQHGAVNKLSLEEALALTLEAKPEAVEMLERPTLEGINPKSLPEALTVYLESHERYYTIWEKRLVTQEQETRGIKQELESLKLQLEGLSASLLEERNKIQNQIHGTLRRQKKGIQPS